MSNEQFPEPERVGDRYRVRVTGGHFDMTPTEVIQFFHKAVRPTERVVVKYRIYDRDLDVPPAEMTSLFAQLFRIIELWREEVSAKLFKLKWGYE